MTGFRIGWAIAPRKLVEIMTNIQTQTTACASVILQVAAEGALTGPQSIVENLRMTIENNRNIMMQELKSINSVKVVEPNGTFYCFPDFSAYTQDSVKLSELLLRKARVVTVPGKEFGMEGRLRLSYAGSVKDITEGVARIRWAIDPNSPNEIYIGDRKMVRDWL
jgi:aspartate aminotransferase